MEMDPFDRITRRLTTGTSRRGAVGSALAGLTALLMSADPLKAKPGSNGKSNGNGQEKRSAKAKNTPKAKGKVWLCHKPTPTFNATTGLLDASLRKGVVIQVSASARSGGPKLRERVRAHLDHGDVECVGADALATPELSPAVIKGSDCFVVEPSTNAAGIFETRRSVTCDGSVPVTTITDPARASSEGSAPE
jgi:hypothetical protein